MIRKYKLWDARRWIPARQLALALPDLPAPRGGMGGDHRRGSRRWDMLDSMIERNRTRPRTPARSLPKALRDGPRLARWFRAVARGAKTWEADVAADVSVVSAVYEVRRVLADPEALARWTEAEVVVDRYARTVRPAGWAAAPASDDNCVEVLAAIRRRPPPNLATASPPWPCAWRPPGAADLPQPCVRRAQDGPGATLPVLGHPRKPADPPPSPGASLRIPMDGGYFVHGRFNETPAPGLTDRRGYAAAGGLPASDHHGRRHRRRDDIA